MPKVLTTAADTTTLLQALGQGYPIVPQELGALGVVASAFVYRPGGVAGGNVFVTWESLVTALATVQGPKTVEIDPRLAAAEVPPGTWLLDDVTLYGAPSTIALLTFQDGAHLVAPQGLIIKAIFVVGALTSPVITLNDGTGLGLELYLAAIATTGAPFVRVENGSYIFVYAVTSEIETAVISADATSPVDIAARAGTFVRPNNPTGTPAPLNTNIDIDASSVVNPPQVVPEVLLSHAGRTAYTASSPSQPAYFLTPPTTVAAGINQLSGAAAFECELLNNTVGQVIADGVMTQIDLPQVGRSVPPGFGSGVLGIVIPVNGVYEIGLTATFGANALPPACDFMRLAIRVGGSLLRQVDRAVTTPSANPTSLQCFYRGFFTAGNTITGAVGQSGGGAVGTLSIAAGLFPRMTAALVR